MAFTRTEENNRTNAVQSFKIDEMGFIPTPPKNLRDMENSKPNKKPFIAVMIKNWEEYKKEKKRRGCAFWSLRFSGIQKANDAERNWESEGITKDVSKESRRLKDGTKLPKEEQLITSVYGYKA